MDEKKLENILEQLQMQLSLLTDRVDILEKSVSKLYKSSADKAEQLSQMHGHLFKTEYDLIGVLGATKLIELDMQNLDKGLAQVKESVKSSSQNFSQ